MFVINEHLHDTLIRMGHKENLVRAARDCLLNTGYARTTVRELVAASGANQASINYHFGSKEQLLTGALLELNAEWGELLFRTLGDPDDVTGNEFRWGRIISSIQNNRELWFVNFESAATALHDDVIRSMITEGQRRARPVLARAFGGLSEDAKPELVQEVGSHYYSLLIGVALQWLIDPAHAPSPAQIVAADGHDTSR